jgi:catechol 2,3-dioxygenase-like lactoylglutathione lyase family enzyme
MLLRMLIAASLLGPVAARAEHAIVPGAPQFVALSVPDASASARWYSEAFGLNVLAEIKPPDGAAHIFLLSSETMLLEILQLRAAKSPGKDAVKQPQLTHGIFKVGFHVPDLEAAVATLRAMKAEFDTEIIDDDKHGLRFVLLRDPDGNYIQLFGKPRTPRGS